MPRSFSLYADPERRSAQSLTASPELGRILDRPEIRDIVSAFGSELTKRSLDNFVVIRPPIDSGRVAEFGAALVQFVLSKEPGVEVHFYDRAGRKKEQLEPEASGEDFPEDAKESSAA